MARVNLNSGFCMEKVEKVQFCRIVLFDMQMQLPVNMFKGLFSETKIEFHIQPSKQRGKINI